MRRPRVEDAALIDEARYRLREHHQMGLELVGSSSPAADAEIIEMTVRFYRRIGITDAEVALNSIGRVEARRQFLRSSTCVGPEKVCLRTGASLMLSEPQSTIRKFKCAGAPTGGIRALPFLSVSFA